MVYGCFLDASKAFQLPYFISFLVGVDLSRCVCIGTVVCQIVSLCPMVYIREVCSLQFYLCIFGFYWGAHFVGAVCYADDIALLTTFKSAYISFC